MSIVNKRTKLAKNVSKDVVLCKTCNHRAEMHLCNVLLQNSISFSKQFQRIPFFLRRGGNSEICIIFINRNEYTRARRTLDQLEGKFRNRLLVNCI